MSWFTLRKIGQLDNHTVNGWFQYLVTHIGISSTIVYQVCLIIGKGAREEIGV
jgi:hypothetical protein